MIRLAIDFKNALSWLSLGPTRAMAEELGLEGAQGGAAVSSFWVQGGSFGAAAGGGTEHKAEGEAETRKRGEGTHGYSMGGQGGGEACRSLSLSG